MFLDESASSFFRRLAFTPDGSLLIVPGWCVLLYVSVACFPSARSPLRFHILHVCMIYLCVYVQSMCLCMGVCIIFSYPFVTTHTNTHTHTYKHTHTHTNTHTHTHTHLVRSLLSSHHSHLAGCVEIEDKLVNVTYIFARNNLSK